MPVQVETMALRAKWEQTSRWLDELPKTTSGMVGVVVFLGAGLLIMRLPTWGFVMGLLGLLAMLCWLALSGQPVVKLTWPSEPLPAPEPLPTPTTTRKPDEAAQRALINEPLEMLELPGGEFWMGSPENEPGRRTNETRNRVRVSPFAMAKYLVTQKLYQEVMEQSPSYFKGESLPVEQVNWFDAVRFCNKLSERVGLRPCYRIVEPKQDQPADGEAAQAEAQPEVEWDQTADGYRLPTEAEWEYACRAKTETAYSFGDDPEQLGEYAWFEGNSESRTHEVETKTPNGWGLSDLHGNVWEWCWDWYAEYPVTSDNDNDKSVSLVCPIGPPSGDGRVLRGGSFANKPRYLRSANRSWDVPTNRNQRRGFRCVRRSARQP